MSLLRKKPVVQPHAQQELKRYLNAFDLTLIGIGAILGAGLFVLTGIAAATKAGPAIMLSYVIAGIACSFAALSYAELSTSVGGSGSAYGYAYAGLGEIVAWVVGWDLILEYGAGACAVAIGWAGYLNNAFVAAGIYIPDYLLKSYFEGGFVNLFALLIVSILTMVLLYGIKQSARVNMFIVLLKMSVIAVFIFAAVPNVEPTNWEPFSPFGWVGVVEGAALVFFAFIGFDAVSTAAEEAINPQRDLSIGTVASLAVCTLLYVVVAGLLTGIANYTTLNTQSPMAEAVLNLGHHTTANIIAIGATLGITSGILILIYALSRIIYSMARDGLIPDYFAKVSKKHKTPNRVIVLVGSIIALMAGFCPMQAMAELVNIGTLAAFAIVCASVIILRYTQPDLERPFKAPLSPFTPMLGIFSCLYLMYSLPLVSWLGFVAWMLVGLVVYFLYGRTHSKLISVS